MTNSKLVPRRESLASLLNTTFRIGSWSLELSISLTMDSKMKKTRIKRKSRLRCILMKIDNLRAKLRDQLSRRTMSKIQQED
jgi:hypothetical protein